VNKFMRKHNIRRISRLDCCVNGCVVFRKEQVNATYCPVCEKPRYNEKKKPVKQFIYFGIGDAIKQRFRDPKWRELSKLIFPPSTDKLQDIKDGEAWQDIRKQHPEFAR